MTSGVFAALAPGLRQVSPCEALKATSAWAVRPLVSVRNATEAEQAARAGVALIDLKEPSDGALGGLPAETVREIVGTVRDLGFIGEISATIGDHLASDWPEIEARMRLLEDTGVDVIKVGVVPEEDPAVAAALVAALAAWRPALARSPLGVVPVLIADRGLACLPVSQALAAPFHAVMLDTALKGGGSLLERVGFLSLAGFVRLARSHARRCGLAGALRVRDIPLLRDLAPDFAGFRSAVCVGGRTQALEVGRVQVLLSALRA